MLRLKWSLVQALWSTVVWNIIIVVLLCVVDPKNTYGAILAIAFAIMLPLPLLYRWRQFYRMYAIHRLFCKEFKAEISIGHKQAFKDRYDTGQWPPFHLLLDNDLIVAANKYSDLQCYESILAEHFNYKKYFGLIVDCDVAASPLVNDF
jgi:hypothetical protein